ncbi:MAG: sodium/solute symporter, partial [Myxococcota bacterium]
GGTARDPPGHRKGRPGDGRAPDQKHRELDDICQGYGLEAAVNLTTVLWLGGLSVSSVLGVSIFAGMFGLAAFAIVYSINGGLKAVALTDIIQLAVLLVGGAAITWSALSMAGGVTGGPAAGWSKLVETLPGHFRMILSADHPAYQDLPGIWTLLGGLWVLHFSYWGFNQYIIQRALGAQSLQEAQKGLAFAAFLKLLVPLIVVLPGIAMVSLVQQGLVDGSALDPAVCAVAGDLTTCGKPDRVYAELMRLTPPGFRGLVFAALIAAIVSSLASMMNSIATIFTMDIYRRSVPNRREQHYVTIGRLTAATAMIIALFLAQPFIGGFESGFQTVQEYSGFVAPGIVAVFLLGFFWKRTNAVGAFAALVSSLALNVLLKLGAEGIPFVIRIWLVFLTCVLAGVVASMLSREDPRAQVVELGDISFATTRMFTGLSVGVGGILVAIYAVLW